MVTSENTYMSLLSGVQSTCSSVDKLNPFAVTKVKNDWFNDMSGTFPESSM